MDSLKRIDGLFSKYLNKQLSESEWQELLVWLSQLSEDEQAALADAQKELWEKAKAGLLPSTQDRVDWGKMRERVMRSDMRVPVRRMFVRVAAAVVLIAGVGVYLWQQRGEIPAKGRNDKGKVEERRTVNSNKAVLTLADGREIVLDSTQSGNIAEQGNTKVIKLDDNQLAYKSADGNVPTGDISYNTISTPRGSQYQVVLPDGSKVWLNAASSIRFPIAFTGGERKVEITGEAYFEIRSNKAQPFFVKATGVEVQVLGTSFNVNAYRDEEDIKTTLLEGSVKVSSYGRGVVVVPGQQAVITGVSEIRGGSLTADYKVRPNARDDRKRDDDRAGNNGKIFIQTIDVQQSIAWVKGYFYFDKAPIKTILRQVSRWYDLDIVYATDVPDDVFSGKIERTLPLQSILRLLNQGNVTFTLEGKRLIVKEVL